MTKRIIYVLGSILIVIGFWNILFEDFWYKFVHYKIFSPIIAFPEQFEFEETSQLVQKQFRIINRSEDIRYNIELHVYFEGLNEQLEMLELIDLDNKRPTQDGKQNIEPSLEELRESIIRALGTNILVIKRGYFQLVNLEKDKRKFLYALIPQLKAKKEVSFAVALWTIRDDKPKTPRKVKISPEIWSFEKTPFITISEKGKINSSIKSEIKIHHKDKINLFTVQTPKRTAIFRYQGKILEGVLDAKQQIWLNTDHVCSILGLQNIPKVLEGLAEEHKIFIHLVSGTTADQHITFSFVSKNKLGHFAKMSPKSLSNSFLMWADKTIIRKNFFVKPYRGKVLKIKNKPLPESIDS